MKNFVMVVLSIGFFVLCAAPSVSCAEDSVRYEVIGGRRKTFSKKCLHFRETWCIMASAVT